MYHELEHVVQYRQKGGVEPFLAEYIANAFGQIIEKRSVDIHDDIEIEQSAISKAALVVQQTAARIQQTAAKEFAFQNNCNEPIRLAIGYQDTDSDWRYEGFWRIESGKEIHPSDQGERLRSRSLVYYFYAESIDGNKKSGSEYKNVNGDGRRLGFKKKDEDASSDTLGTNLTCNS